MTAPELTLAIPYYSGFPLFVETLKSIARQSHDHCRVLVVDDSPHGFRDEELRQIDAALAGRFPHRLLRNTQNLGMARSWNRCLDAAETDLVTIVHNDDELTPEYASVMVALAQAEPLAVALFCGAEVIGADSKGAFSVPDLVKLALIPRHGDVLRLQGDAALASLMRGNYIFCPSLCYRKSRLGDVRFDAGYRFTLDMDLTVRLLLAGQTLVGVPKRKLYRYRRHQENATQHLTRELTRFHEESDFYNEVDVRATKRGFTRAARVARKRRIIQLNLAFCIVRDLAGRQWSDGGRKLSLFRRLFLQSPSA